MPGVDIWAIHVINDKVLSYMQQYDTEYNSIVAHKNKDPQL